MVRKDPNQSMASVFPDKFNEALSVDRRIRNYKRNPYSVVDELLEEFASDSGP